MENKTPTFFFTKAERRFILVHQNLHGLLIALHLPLEFFIPSFSLQKNLTLFSPLIYSSNIIIIISWIVP